MIYNSVFISMSKIIKDIIDDVMDDVVIKPEKSKKIIKWIVRISVLAIIIAFIVGQLRITYLNKFDTIESDIIELEKTDLILMDNDKQIENKINGLKTDIDKNTEKIDKNTDRIIEKIK